jgi:phosphatidylglycerol:prolipoprotein diacylglycerol transferase
VPIGLFLGRIANFINGELVGRVTSPNLPWSMVFPHVDLYPQPKPP